MTTTYTATAPGKLVLFGEYVVLEGAPALVTAMEPRARATFVTGAPGALPVWNLHAPTLDLHVALEARGDAVVPLGGAQAPPALALMVRLLTEVHRLSAGRLPPGTLTLDTQAFYKGTVKLGLGSSGAITVAAWHALATAAELTPMGPQTTIATLRAVHSASQGGQGSGIDLAASLMGGVVRYQLGQASAVHPEVVGPLSATHVRPLPELHMMPMWTGQPAVTGTFLAAFAALKKNAPQAFWPLCEEMALISRAACELWALGEVTPLLPLVTRSMTALEHLGKAMQVELITDVHRQAAAAAQASGAFYKPSGAGGGDFGLLFAESHRSLQRASRALVAQGLTPMPLPQGGKGLIVHKKD
jgi:phosphomevalonate kinase